MQSINNLRTACIGRNNVRILDTRLQMHPFINVIESLKWQEGTLSEWNESKASLQWNSSSLAFFRMKNTLKLDPCVLRSLSRNRGFLGAQSREEKVQKMGHFENPSQAHDLAGSRFLTRVKTFVDGFGAGKKTQIIQMMNFFLPWAFRTKHSSGHQEGENILKSGTVP